jgi:hydrogenase-4 membrane subunit HyfE
MSRVGRYAEIALVLGFVAFLLASRHSSNGWIFWGALALLDLGLLVAVVIVDYVVVSSRRAKHAADEAQRSVPVPFE